MLNSVINKFKNKTFSLIVNDAKLILRYYSLIFVLFWGITIVILIYFFGNIRNDYLIYFSLLIFLFLKKIIFNNIFARSTNEFWTYNILPISNYQLIYTKNISIVLCTFLPIILINAIMTFLLGLSIIQYIKSTYLVISTITILLTLGNFLSIRAQKGKNKRKGVLLTHIYIYQTILVFSTFIHYKLINLFKLKIYYITYILLIGCIYFYTLKKYSVILEKEKYNLLGVK